MSEYTEILMSEKEDLITHEKEEPIVDTMKYPASAVGYLEFNLDGKLRRGTAFLIHRNMALTCAHNCYSLKTKMTAEALTFFPARSKNVGFACGV